MFDRDVQSAQIVLEADTSQIAYARRFIRGVLGDADPGVLDDLQLIASELFTNAVEHGVDLTVRLCVETSGGFASVSVHSRGLHPGIGPTEHWAVAEPSATSGRGLGIVRRLADDVVVERIDDEVIVTARVARHR
jgi:anti-sigma regulatory factor (Ser/Thr protein kinase)